MRSGRWLWATWPNRGGSSVRRCRLGRGREGRLLSPGRSGRLSLSPGRPGQLSGADLFAAAAFAGTCVVARTEWSYCRRVGPGGRVIATWATGAIVVAGRNCSPPPAAPGRFIRSPAKSPGTGRPGKGRRMIVQELRCGPSGRAPPATAPAYFRRVGRLDASRPYS